MNVGFYTFGEQIANQYRRHIKPQFEINANISFEALLIRLLLGTVSFTNDIEDIQFIQNNNYSLLGVQNNFRVTTKIIRDCFEPEIKLQSLCDILDETKYINRQFYENLLMEITCYFHRKQEDSHTLAFLHIYRSLEFISYSFPLIYASITRDYHGSFNSLKNYFNDAKNDLAFFDTFLQKLFDGQTTLDQQFTLQFNCFEPRLNQNHFRVIKQILTDTRYTNPVDDISITVQYKHLLFLVQNLRNRYFHFSVGDKRNIRTTEIYETDLFFNIINEEAINWISVIYFEILKASIIRTN